MALWDLFSKKKSAQDLLLAGNLQGALKGFKRELKAKNNKDPLLMLKIGSIYQEMKDQVRARMYFMAVGEYYGEHGFFNKAVAAYKKALEITPNDKSILAKLASYNNKVPKYMINSQILEEIRLNAEELERKAAMAREGIDPENCDATFKFPDGDEELVFEPAEPLVAKTANEEKTPSDSPEIAAEPVQEIHADPIDVQEPEPSAAPINPLDNADPDFDPNASLQLEEEEFFEAVESMSETADDEADNQPFAIDSDIIPHPAPTEPTEPTEPADSPREPSPLVPEPQGETSEPEVPSNDQQAPATTAPSTTSKSLSKDQKMVFSTRSSTKPVVENDSRTALRSFSSLDDALEDLFSMGPEEDMAARKEQDQRHFPLFRTMSTDVFVDFVMALENREFDPGDVVIKQGDPGQDMFIIVEGEVDIILSSDALTSTVANLHTGDFFGEAALITGRPRTASVVAKTPTSCLLLSRNHYEELAANHPSVVETIGSINYTRMRENESHGE